VINYSDPRYSLRDAASASGFSLNTLRSNFQRGWFRVIGGQASEVGGLPHMLSLRDVLHIAAAERLWEAGVHPEVAFRAALNFAHAGGDDGPANFDRHPGGTFQSARTLLIYWPHERDAKFPGKVIAVPADRPEILIDELFSPTASATADTAVVVDLEEVEFKVIRFLKADAD
jgi:hypothetical protein